MGYKTAFINSFGEVTSVVNTGLDDLYINGQTYGDLIAIHIDDTINPDEFIRSKYYDLDTQVFQSRTICPSEYHIWRDRNWQFDYASAISDLRKLRTHKLFESDWTQMPDSPITSEKKQEWQTYRQALRDLPDSIPTTIQSMEEVIWPIPPV